MKYDKWLSVVKKYSKAVEHAIERARERYDVQLDIDDYRILVNQIHQNASTFYCRVNRAKTIHIVRNDGKELYSLYNKYTQLIMTFLTKYQVYRNEARGW